MELTPMRVSKQQFTRSYTSAMELQRTTLVISVLLTISIITTPILATPSFAEAVAQQQQQVVHYSNSWAVEVQGGVEEADALAQKHGLINYGQVNILVARGGNIYIYIYIHACRL